MPAGLNSVKYRKIFDEEVLPFIEASCCDLLIISAGFDAHKWDPIAHINLETEDFSYMVRSLMQIKSQLLIGLEGGYDLKALADCCTSIAKELIKH